MRMLAVQNVQPTYANTNMKTYMNMYVEHENLKKDGIF